MSETNISSDPYGIASKIRSYDFTFNCDYLGEILSAAPLEEVCTAFNELLRSEDEELFSETCGVLRDAIFCHSHPRCATFIKNFKTSSVVKTLESILLTSPSYSIRHQVIYTLGKTCCYGSLETLQLAFQKFRDTDPLSLPRLLGEMGWLGAENFWELLEEMAVHPHYVTRWAVLDILPEFGGDDAREQNELFQIKFDFWSQLRQDSHPLVRGEAEYNYQFGKWRTEAHELTRSERKKQQKALEKQYAPALTFFSIKLKFTNALSSRKVKSYTIAELEDFVEKLLEEKQEKIRDRESHNRHA